MKDIKNIWWDYSSILAAQVVAVPFSILYISYVARVLGPQGWGVFSLFLSVVQFLFCCVVSWTSASVVRFGKEEFTRNENLRKTFTARLVIVLLSVLIFSIPLFIMKNIISGYIGLSGRPIWFILFMLIVYAFFDHLIWTLKAIGAMKPFAFTTALRQLFLLLFIAVFLAIFSSFSTRTVIVLEILSYAAASIFCMFFIKLKYIFPLSLDIGMLRNILIYSWPLIFAFFLGYASNWMDAYFIKYYLSPFYVGIYQAAYRLIEYIRTPLYGIIILAFPLLMSIKTNGRGDLISIYIKRLTPQAVMAWNIIISIVVLLSYPVVKLIFGASYAEAALPFSVLLLGIGFQAISVMYTSLFSIYDWLKFNTMILFFVCLVNFIGDILLVPRIGMLGAAIATVISYIIGSISYLLVVNKLISIRAYKALPYPFMTFISFLVCTFIKQFHLKVFGVFGAIIIFVIIAKYTKLFIMEDAVLWDKIEMPRLVRRCIKMVYSSLS